MALSPIIAALKRSPGGGVYRSPGQTVPATSLFPLHTQKWGGTTHPKMSARRHFHALPVPSTLSVLILFNCLRTLSFSVSPLSRIAPTSSPLFTKKPGCTPLQPAEASAKAGQFVGCATAPRVYRALATQLVGHMDPWFRTCMDETQTLLRQIFQTENRVTFPLSASGSGGIEAAVLNSLEPGDEAICCVNGAFSERMYVIAQHTPATVHIVQAPYGKPVDPEDVRKATNGRKIKMRGLAQGVTSSGVLTDLNPFRKVADEFGALLVVDTVASLAAVPLHVDKQRIDICFSGSQKAISAPPGMSPITVSPRAE